MELQRAKPRLGGVIPPVLTPFDTDRSIDYRAWEHLVAWLVERGVDALFVSGGSGEWTHLAPAERIELTRRAVAVVGGEIPVIAGSLGRDFRETLQLSQAMAEAGADFLGVVIPHFVAPEEGAICGFFERLFDAFPYPTMLYDPPDSGAYSMQPPWLKRLAGRAPAVALKKSTRDLRIFTQLIEAAGGNLSVICGDETVMLPCLAVGATGCIGGGANMFPELLGAVMKAFAKGDLEKARAAQIEIERANQLIGKGSWPLVGKIALAARGLPIQPITRRTDQSVSRETYRLIETFFRTGAFAGI